MKTKRRKLGKRIQISYFLIIAVFFFATVVVGGGVLRNFIIKQTQADLNQAGTLLIERLSVMKMDEVDNLTTFYDMRVLSRYNSTKFLLVNHDGIIAFGDPALKSKALSEVIEKAKGQSRLIYESFPVEGKLSNRFSQLVLYTTVSEITQVNQVILRGSMIALVITSLLALILSFVMQKRISKPLIELEKAIEDYKSDSSVRPQLKTGDEFEDLSDTLTLFMNRIEEISKRQKIFFQNASHELKTPLMSIQGYAEGIKDGVIGVDEMEASIDVIIFESQRLKGIVEEMILLTKLDDEGESFRFERVSLADIFERAQIAVHPILFANGIEVEKKLDELAIGLFDAEKMTRVFINLLSNGCRYAKKKITVSIQMKGTRIYVDVMDDGAGFDIGDEDKVFDRFYKSESGGSGIGLSLTKTIIERHGGSIQAVNNVGMGALFKMEFPVEAK